MFRRKKNVDQLSKKIMRHCSNGLTHIIILWIISKEKIHGYGIMKKLDEEIKRRKITFDLKMSIGYSIIDPKSKENVEKNLQQADKLMYVVKKCHHETSKR